MEYSYLGRTGLRVSRLCFGTMNFGRDTTEEESRPIMDEALASGLNFWDTANVYGSPNGMTESIIGRWLADDKSRRDQIVLATKVYGTMGEGENERGLSAKNIKLACEASLTRLQTDYIDMYQMHHIQRNTPWEEIWQAMEQLVQEGKVLYIGSSNFAGWHIAQAQEAAKARHFMGLVSEQSLYNLITRTIEMEVLPACEAYGLGIIPWSPLSGGKLAGKKSGGVRRERAFENFNDPESRLERYETFCEELGESPAIVALAWLLHQPIVTAPIIGPRTMEQLTSAYRAVELKLDEAALRKLDEIFPGPGGPAPEAYAW